MDDRDNVSSGFKFNDWEMRGVPIRIELGPRDVEKGNCVLVRRDNGDKRVVPLADAEKALAEALDLYASGLVERAWTTLTDNVKDYKTAAEVKGVAGIARVGWCGAEACGKDIQNVTEKTVLGVPLDVAFGAAFAEDTKQRLSLPGKGFAGHCASCGKATATPVLVAKTY
jgi:prolyl-tRNA synthetase